MGKTNPDAPKHKQQSMILVPMDTPGVTIVRPLTVFGYLDQPGLYKLLFLLINAPHISFVQFVNIKKSHKEQRNSSFIHLHFFHLMAMYKVSSFFSETYKLAS